MHYHVHICSKCNQKWADNIVVSNAAVCPFCGLIQKVKDGGDISEQACLTLKVYYRRVR